MPAFLQTEEHHIARFIWMACVGTEIAILLVIARGIQTGWASARNRELLISGFDIGGPLYGYRPHPSDYGPLVNHPSRPNRYNQYNPFGQFYFARFESI